jgi:NDP-sugar pyrophosphorylase family protein
VLPHVVGHASGYVIEDYLLDIGTPEKLDQAENDIKNGKIKFINCRLLILIQECLISPA